LEGGPGLDALPFMIISLVPRLLPSFAMYCVILGTRPLNAHAAVTVDIVFDLRLKHGTGLDLTAIECLGAIQFASSLRGFQDS